VQERRVVATLTAPPPAPGRFVTGSPAGPRLVVGGVVAAAVVAVDQLTKQLALDKLADGPVDLIWTLRLKLIFNKGAAFGLGTEVAPVLVAVAIAVVVILLGFGRHAVQGRGASTSLGLVVGGAVGNLVDRVVRGHDGAVVDFIDLSWWPVFNVADIDITCGAILLVVVGRSARPPEAAR